jgi:hypothetical protein
LIFMRGVSRIGLVVLLFAAFLVAAEPTYHQHPLTGSPAADGLSATAYSAICAVGGSQTILTRPIVLVTATVAYLLVLAPVALRRSAVRTLLPARAPPVF